MSIKVILFDIDGVLIRCPHYFSKELEEQGYENAVEVLNEYYGGVHNHCLEGREETESMIEPFLQNIQWNEGVSGYFQSQYNFDREYVCTELLDYIIGLREKGILCHLGTDQEKIRKKILLEQFDFKEKFDGYFISCDVGSRKSGARFWESVLKALQEYSPSKIAFFDDVQTNVDKAKEFGIQAFLFTDMEQFKGDMNHLGFDIKNLYE